MNSHFDAPRAKGGVLITGGCGFLGSNLADALAERGETVCVLDNLGRAGVEKNAEWLRLRHERRVALEIADIRDLRAVNRLVARASAVLHLAAQVAVTTSLTHPADDLDINIRGTLNVLESVRLNNPEIPVILASTNKVYGPLFTADQVVVRGERYVPLDERRAVGIDECTPLDPYSPYGCSKAAADQYMHDYARVFGLRTVVLRMSCIYGQRQFGTEDQGWIAHFLRQVMRGLPVTIYGDGYQVRDALFVRDAVDAWLGARDRIDQVSGKVFNLGGGPRNAVSLREMMTMIKELGLNPQYSFAPWRPGDQPWYVSDIREISKMLDWTPRVAVRDGLAMLRSWIARRIEEPHARVAEPAL